MLYTSVDVQVYAGPEVPQGTRSIYIDHAGKRYWASYDLWDQRGVAGSYAREELLRRVNALQA